MVSPVKFEPLEGFYIKCAMLHKLKPPNKMKKYNLTIEKIPAFGFLIGYSETDGLIIMIPFRTIVIKKQVQNIEQIKPKTI